MRLSVPPPICRGKRCRALFWPTASMRRGWRTGAHHAGVQRARSAGCTAERLLCWLHRAWIGAAIEQNVLTGYEAGLGAAQERAGETELFGIAEPAGRIFGGPLGENLLGGDAGGLGLAGGNTCHAVGGERARQ